MVALRAASSQVRLDRHRAVNHAVFGLLPVLISGWLLLYVVTARFGAADFRQAFWTAGWRTLHGHDLYLWTTPQILSGKSFPYPAPAALLFAPFALLPSGLAGALFTVLCVMSAGLALHLLVPLDWRLYGIVALWPPVVSGWQTANLTLPLLLGTACLWRYRDRPLIAGALTGLLISLKPIMFPLWIWLAATRRYSSAGWALLAGICVNVAAWSIIGWSEVGTWLHLLSVQGRVVYRSGYAIVALASDLGTGRAAGMVLQIVLAVLVVASLVWLGRRKQDVASFALATLLMVVASPQVDLHYFALLLVPLALVHRRLHWSWAVPLGLWLCPAASTTSAWLATLWWIAAGLVVAETLRAHRSHASLVRLPHSVG